VEADAISIADVRAEGAITDAAAETQAVATPVAEEIQEAEAKSPQLSARSAGEFKS
jgi:hypothetical protein